MQDNQIDAKNAIIIAPKQEAYPNLNRGNPGNEGGGVPKYNIKYCDEIIAFFSIPKKVRYIKRERIKTNKDGSKDVYYEYAYMPNELPTIEKFARSIGVVGSTIVTWAGDCYADDHEVVEKRGKFKRPKFHAAYLRAKELQKEFLIDNGLEGNYNPIIFTLVVTNMTDMRNTKPVDSTPSQPGDQISEVASFNYLPPQKLQEIKPDEPNNTDNSTNA